MENINKIIILTLSLLLLINMNLNAEKNDGIQQTIENFIIYMKNNKKEEIDNIITNNELKDKIHSLMNNYKIIDFNYFINSMSNINDLNLNEKKVVIRYNMKYEKNNTIFTLNNIQSHFIIISNGKQWFIKNTNFISKLETLESSSFKIPDSILMLSLAHFILLISFLIYLNLLNFELTQIQKTKWSFAAIFFSLPAILLFYVKVIRGKVKK